MYKIDIRYIWLFELADRVRTRTYSILQISLLAKFQHILADDEVRLTKADQKHIIVCCLKEKEK